MPVTVDEHPAPFRVTTGGKSNMLEKIIAQARAEQQMRDGVAVRTSVRAVVDLAMRLAVDFPETKLELSELSVDEVAHIITLLTGLADRVTDATALAVEAGLRHEPPIRRVVLAQALDINSRNLESNKAYKRATQYPRLPRN